MANYVAEIEITFDAKGRFMLPANYLRRMGEIPHFVYSRGFENCLTLYTAVQWEVAQQQLYEASYHDPEGRRFWRLFLRGATEVEKDGAGRILIQKPMLEYAGITKDAIFSVQPDKVEIWDKKRFDAEMTLSDPDEMSRLAASVHAKALALAKEKQQ